MSGQPFDPSHSPTLTRDVGEGVTHALPLNHRDSLSPGQTYGPYLIHRLLGKGGMGEVYEAEHRETGRRVALKVLADRDPLPEARERFLREGRLAAAISHPNSVYIYGTEEIAGQWAISMELLGGGSLKDRLRETGPLSTEDAVAAILQIIGGLEAAAAAGVLHRDIKPANCFVELDGTVKIGDFGLSLSTLARDRSRSQLTQSGAFMGTPAFASPEQLRGDDLDVRSDIYSVGRPCIPCSPAEPPSRPTT
jgi:serine/threonine protein kinase